MESLHKQINKLSFAIMKKMVEEPEVVLDHITKSELERLIPVELRAIYSQVKYLAPTPYEVLKKRLGTMIEMVGEPEVIEEMDDVECPDDNETVTMIQELLVLNNKKSMQDTLAKSISDLESGEVNREQEAIDRLSILSDTYKRTTKIDEAKMSENCIDIQNDEPEAILKKLLDSDRSDFPKTGTIFDTWMVLGPGELGVVLAGPAVGKTTALVDIGAGYIEHNHNGGGVVVHFSEEMSMASVLRKYMSRFDAPDIQKLKDKGGLVIESHASGTSTVPFLKSRVINLLNGRKPLAIVVDYLAIMQRGKQSGYDSLSDIVVDLRGMAGYFGCPVWTGSQPQRTAFRDFNNMNTMLKNFKPPVLGMADVAECWAIPHVSDYVVSLNQTEDEKEMDIPEVRVHGAKVRIPIDIKNFDKKKLERTIKAQVDYGKCIIS